MAVVMVSVRVGDRALPVAWLAEEGPANIGFEGQKQVLERVLAWLPTGADVSRPGPAIRAGDGPGGAVVEARDGGPPRRLRQAGRRGPGPGAGRLHGADERGIGPGIPAGAGTALRTGDGGAGGGGRAGAGIFREPDRHPLREAVRGPSGGGGGGRGGGVAPGGDDYRGEPGGNRAADVAAGGGVPGACG